MFNKLKKLLSITVLLIITIGCNNKEPEKLILGGWADGSIAGYRLKVYPDYTFDLGNFLDVKGGWMYRNDTIVLLLDEKICAKIYKEKLVEYNNCSGLRPLTIMKFVENEEPKVLIFPN